MTCRSLLEIAAEILRLEQAHEPVTAALIVEYSEARRKARSEKILSKVDSASGTEQKEGTNGSRL